MITLYDFASPPTRGKWRSINDDVMGGVSRGGFRILSDSARLEFTGELSLENRGGFASIRSFGTAHDLSGFDGVALRVRGDGRTYSTNLRTDQLNGGSYRRDFPTKKDEWVTVRVPFSKLRATFRGRPIPDAPSIDRARLTSLGVILADKREGPFKLEIDWIRAYKADATHSGSKSREDSTR